MKLKDVINKQPCKISKGTVQQDFRLPFFFHHSNRSEPLTNGIKYFRFWFRFRRVILIFRSSAQYHTVLSKVKFCEVSYCAESDNRIWGESSAQYDTARNLPPAVWYCAELDSAKYCMILCKAWLRAVSYCVESLYTARSQQPLLETFAQAFKGTVS